MDHDGSAPETASNGTGRHELAEADADSGHAAAAAPDSATGSGDAAGAATAGGAAAGGAAALGAAGLSGHHDADAAHDAAAAHGTGAGDRADPPFGPDSAHPLPDGSAPGPEYTVKGNADSMLFHTTDSPYYVRTRAEAWFTTAEAAVAAGFAPWNQRRKEAALQGLAASAPAWEPGPYPQSAKPAEDGTSPAPEFTVKGNADSMLYHTPESPYYVRTRAEAWFRTAADAEAAGFTAYARR